MAVVPLKMTRRGLLKCSASAGLLAVSGGAAALASEPNRKKDALSVRAEAAKHGVPCRFTYLPKQLPDEVLRVTEFSKCLDRDLVGRDSYLPKPEAFKVYRQALDAAYGEGNAIDANQKIEAISSHIATQITLKPGDKPLRLTNPLGGLAFDLEGFDPPLVPIRREPCFESEETKAEMAELYWMAFLRDRRFSEFDSLTPPTNAPADPANLTLQDAVNDLAKYHWFDGPNDVLLEPRAFWRARVPASWIRGSDDEKRASSRRSFAGVSIGPYVSQFLIQGTDVAGDNTQSVVGGVLSFGPQRLSQKTITLRTSRSRASSSSHRACRLCS